MTTTLSQRLRDMRIGLFPDIETVNAVLDECIAQAEREAQAGEHEKGRDPVSIALARNNAALMEWRGEVKANEPKTLTDDEIDRVTDDLGLGSRGRASFRAGLRYARDHYLKPSQVIGEQTPVAIKDSEVLTACETYADNYMIEGRITTSLKAMRMALTKFMEGRPPISTEARDLAIEALATTQHLWMCEDEGMVSGQPTARDYRRAREKVDQALSALRAQ